MCHLTSRTRKAIGRCEERIRHSLREKACKNGPGNEGMFAVCPRGFCREDLIPAAAAAAATAAALALQTTSIGRLCTA